MEAEGDEGSHPTQIPSTDFVPKLPEELITAILVRLPVKVLLQFKSVSKHWFTLISSPHFVKTHLSFSTKDCTRHKLLLGISIADLFKYAFRDCYVSSLLYGSVTQAVDLDYPLKDLDPERIVHIVGSVNGLICYRIGVDALVLWNPSTRKFKQLPEVMPKENADHRFNYGFGYDEVRDDYKVVAIFRYISKRYVDAKIYSLKSDSWITLDDFQSEMIFPNWGKLVKGKLHWVTTADDGWGIMSIDLVDEKCRKVEQPCCGVEYFQLTLGALGSDLSVLCSDERTDVWVMKEYGVKESWTKLYTIKCLYCVLSPPLCMSIEGEILHVLESNLTIYNPEDDFMRYLEVTNVDGYVKAEFYIESLVCPVLQNEPLTQH